MNRKFKTAFWSITLATFCIILLTLFCQLNASFMNKSINLLKIVIYKNSYTCIYFIFNMFKYVLSSYLFNVMYIWLYYIRIYVDIVQNPIMPRAFPNFLSQIYKKKKKKIFLFVTYTIIQSITSSEICSLYLTHPSAHTPGAVCKYITIIIARYKLINVT